MRIDTEADEQRWTDAAGMPPLTEEQKDELLAEMEQERSRMPEADRLAGEALFVLRMDWQHTTESAAAIAVASPGAHVAILAHLLSLASDDAALMMIGANWLCGAARDDGFGGGGGDDDGPDPEPGPRPPGATRRIRNPEMA